MKKHWSHNLPEAGRIITTQADLIVRNEQEILNLHEQIAYLRRESAAIESQIETAAKVHWSKKEIEAAKRAVVLVESDTMHHG